MYGQQKQYAVIYSDKILLMSYIKTSMRKYTKINCMFDLHLIKHLHKLTKVFIIGPGHSIQMRNSF